MQKIKNHKVQKIELHLYDLIRKSKMMISVTNRVIKNIQTVSTFLENYRRCTTACLPSLNFVYTYVDVCVCVCKGK